MDSAGSVKQVIVVRKDLNMRKGKLSAQVAHAAMKFILDNNESDDPMKIILSLSPDESFWCGSRFTKIVLGCGSEGELRDLIMQAELRSVSVYPIVDSGQTEFRGMETLTCASFGPCAVNEIDPITGHLKPL